ncbi:MAG: peptidase M48 [Candidatus Marinimicrobia bacterium]|nr:peptidase M48 [Candidatus Neomarinimicrobiota bacterium]|tara:strand:- start:22026 stop:23282 length:1257 start_codon:yes stop_codon:yes gene_type:complete
MNIYFLIIISAIVFEFLLSIVVNKLNLNALSPKLPEEFSDVYDKEKYAKSQDYTRENTKFSFFTSTFFTILTLLVILFGFFNHIDLFVRKFENNDIISGLLFYGILYIINDLIMTPFSLYKNFIIEEKFKFNKMKLSTFFIDKIKGYFLIIIIGAPIISLILYLFEGLGSYAWLYAWGAVSLLSLAIQPVFNLFIAPIFNKFTPLDEGSLLSEIKAYVEKVNFPIAKVDVMDGSKRSSHSNAYFSGIGKTKRIALFDTLLEKQKDEEILAVIAHEVGHYKCKHIQKGIILGIVQSGIMFYLMSLFINNEDLFTVFKMENLSIYASLLFFGMLYAPIEMVLAFIFNYLSRKHEFEADEYSAKTTGKPENLISSLKKLSAENLSNLTPHWLNVALNYSHPPTLQRINALKLYLTKNNESY